MFRGDAVITGGTFKNITRTQSSFNFDKLTQKASPRAFHQADSDLSHSTCFRNTRTNVLDRLKDWALRKSDKDKSILWLHGAAGGGKTSIARTIAKWCDEDEGILLGEFFFSRADGLANQFTTFAPTIAYRMAAHTCKEAKKAICQAINKDPHILSAPLAYQLKKLVLEPLDTIAPSGITPYVIILDGLDETLSSEEQLTMLNVLSETVCHHNPSLRILICSRPEPIIATTFRSSASNLKNISTTISLNDEVDSDSDIRRFLVEKFRAIREELPYPLHEDWPTPADIDYLVAKSSGQFIFAATVEKYVCSPQHRHLAITRLKHVLDLRLLDHIDKAMRPFAELDALYALILKTRNDVILSVKTMAICLEYPKYFDTINTFALAKVLRIELNETLATLYELASLLETTKEGIRPFHASFGDFLFDSSRSGDLYLCKRDIATDIICGMLIPRRDPKDLQHRVFFHLLKEASPRQDLTNLLVKMTPASIFNGPSGHRASRGSYYLIPLLKQLKSHLPPHEYTVIVAYFDRVFASRLPFGKFNSSNFREADSSDSMPSLPTISATGSYWDDTDTDTDGSDTDSQQKGTYKSIRTKHSKFPAYELALLSTSPAWDEINAKVNLTDRLYGPHSLRGLCDESSFVRTTLHTSFAKLLDGKVQETAALFCFKKMEREGTPADVQDAFAKLLPHSLNHSERSPALNAAVKHFLTKKHKVPEATMIAISEYAKAFPASESRNVKANTDVARKATDAPLRPSGSTTKPTSRPTSSVEPPKSPATSKISGPSQKPVPQPPLASAPRNQTPSSSRTFLVPPHNQTTSSKKGSTPTRPSSSRSTSSLPPPSPSLDVPKSSPSQPASSTSQPSSRPDPSPSPSRPLDEAQTSSKHSDTSLPISVNDNQPSNTRSPSAKTKGSNKTSSTRGKKKTKGKR